MITTALIPYVHLISTLGIDKVDNLVFTLHSQIRKIQNLETAFKIAEAEWCVPRLLDPEDFLDTVDPVSVMIYMYQWFSLVK